MNSIRMDLVNKQWLTVGFSQHKIRRTSSPIIILRWPPGYGLSTVITPRGRKAHVSPTSVERQSPKWITGFLSASWVTVEHSSKGQLSSSNKADCSYCLLLENLDGL